MAKTKQTGTLEFGSDNGIDFFVRESNDTAASFNDTGRHLAAHTLSWSDNPASMAKKLRKAADWLDKHADKDICAEVD